MERTEKRIIPMFLSDEQILKYKIMSREACERYCKQKHDRSSVVISIKSTWDRVDPKVFANDINGVKHILFLAIDDIEAEDDPRSAMNEDQGKIVADFVNAYYDETDRIQCQLFMRWDKSWGFI